MAQIAGGGSCSRLEDKLYERCTLDFLVESGPFKIAEAQGLPTWYLDKKGVEIIGIKNKPKVLNLRNVNQVRS
jgi:hypothetical protein